MQIASNSGEETRDQNALYPAIVSPGCASSSWLSAERASSIRDGRKR